MWQALRNEHHHKGFELVTVGLDALGIDGCRPYIEAAQPQHPSLIDQHHLLASLFGVINIPQGVWIDEQGMIVRPAEVAPAPPRQSAPTRLQMPAEAPQRLKDMMVEAGKIRNDSDSYHLALRDWIEHGANSRFALKPSEVVKRSRPRDGSRSLGHAHFELATQLEQDGHHEDAIKHFREAHRLVPESWTFRRQAWSLERMGEGPLARFWQGPDPSRPDDWPYAGDWLADIQKVGAENYNEPWTP